MADDKTRFEIFISSRMREFSDERKMLFELIPTLSTDVVDLKAWVYEINAPASDHSIRENYLKTLIDSELYIGIFGQGFGKWTVDEFNIATRESIPRHVYVLVMDDDARDEEQAAFIKQIQGVEFGIAPRYFTNLEDLRRAVADSVRVWLRERLMHRPGSTTATFANQPLMVENVPGKLIGRDHLLARINPLLGSGETVLLRGFGGMGKTALAATIAKQHIIDGKGAVLWQKLGSEDSDAIFQSLARPFGAHQNIAAAQSDDEKRGIIRQLIVGGGVSLVVLDDAWNGKTLNAVLRAVPNGIPAVVTSRHRYGLRQIIEVAELAPDKAIETLGYYANADYTNNVSASALCQHLGYHAFALEIAGQTIRADNLSPSQLLDRIKDAPQRLKVPDEFADEGRATVADLITASLNMLDNETQRVFMAMGAFFAKQMTAEMLALYFNGKPEVSDEMLADIRGQNPSFSDRTDDEMRQLILQQLILPKLELDIQSIERAFEVLGRRGLVEIEKPSERSAASARIHDLAYAYAHSSHSDEHIHRALDACIMYTWRHNEPSLENFSALRPELDNFLGAANWAITADRLLEVERFAWNLYPVGGSRFLNMQGFYTQAVTLLELAAQAAAHRGNLRDQAAHLGNLGLVYGSLGRLEDNVKTMTDVLELARQIGDRQYEGNALGNLGNSYENMKQHTKAIEHHEQDLAIRNEIGDQRGKANALGNLGNVYANLGQHDRALDYYQQALVISRQIGDRQGEGSLLGNLGNTYSDLGQYEKAVEYHTESLEIARRIGDHLGEGNRLNNISNIYAEQGHYDLALDHFLKARAIFTEIRALHMVDLVDRNIAIVQRRMAGAGGIPAKDPNIPTVPNTQTLTAMLLHAYREGGEEGVRKQLTSLGAPDMIIQSAIEQFRKLGGGT